MNTLESLQWAEQSYTQKAAGNRAAAAAARQDEDEEYAEYMDECAADAEAKAAYFTKRIAELQAAK